MVEPPPGLYHVLQGDVKADWSDGANPPPSILLDFMYGAAVVKHWKCDRLREMLEQRFGGDFGKAQVENPKCSVPDDDEYEVKLDDSNYSKDPNWEPSKGKRKGRKMFSSDAIRRFVGSYG